MFTNVLGTFNSVLGLLFFALLLLKLFALVDAAMRRADLYEAASKLNKPFWLIILGIAVLWDLLAGSLLSMLSVAGLVAAIVYVVDVRPALRSIGGRGGRRGDGRHMGPYGPW